MSPQPPSLPQGAFHAPLPFNVLPKAPEGTLVCQPAGCSSFMSESNRRHVRSRPGAISSGAFALQGSSSGLHRRVGCTGRTVPWQGCRPLRTGVGVPAAEVDSGRGEVVVGVEAVVTPGQTLMLDAVGAAAAATTAAAATATAAAPAVDDEAIHLGQGKGGRNAVNGSSSNNSNTSNSNQRSKSPFRTAPAQQTRQNGRQVSGSKEHASAPTTSTTTAPAAGTVAAGTPGKPFRRLTEPSKTEASLLKKKERQTASRASALMRRMTDAGKQGR